MRTTRLAALLFIEIADFPELLARDEGRALESLAEFRALAEPLLSEHAGLLVDASGEELLVLFESAVAAVQCGLHLFLATGSRNAAQAGRPPLKLRAGIHLGEIWQDETRVYGNGVNIAARVKAEAEVGSLLVSEDVYRQISNKLDLPARELSARSLKNIERPLLLYELVSASGVSVAHNEVPPPEAPPPPRPPARRPHQERRPEGPNPAARAADLHGERRDKTRELRATGLRTKPAELSLAARRDAAEKELFTGLGKFLGSGALCAGFAYGYARSDNFWFAIAALLLGLFPSMSGLKKFLRAALDLRDVKRETRKGRGD